MVSQGKQGKRIQLLTNQACEGGKKRENPSSWSSTDFKPPEPRACVFTQRLGWRKAHRNLCLLKQWLHTELGCTTAVTGENGEPRTYTRCLTKTRIKNRQTAVGRFVSYTIYSRLRGFSFFPVKHRKEVTENTSAAATASFSPKKRSVKH